MPTLPVNGFELGITDDYLDGPTNACKKANNLLIDRNKKLVQRPGLDVYNDNATQIPPGNQRIDSLYKFDGTLFAKSGTKLYFIEDGDTAWSTLAGPNTDAFADSSLGAGCSWSEWRGHLYITPHPGPLKTGSRTVKVFRSSSSNWTLFQAGVPSIKEESSDFALIGTGSGGTEHSYILARVYTDTYIAEVNGIATTFTFYGRPEYAQITQEQITNTVYPSANAVPFTNDTYENYQDNALSVVTLFRTKPDEQTLYWAKTENQSSSLDWDTNDADLGVVDDDSYTPILYTDGGIKDHGPVPVCYFSLVLDGYGFYAAGTDYDTNQFFAGRIWQSNPANPDGVYYGNYVDVPGVITAMSSVGSYPIVFTDENKCYRLEGRFDAFGGGGIRAKLISESDGCIAPASVVKREGVVYFATATGWSVTDGFKSQKISDHLRNTFEALENKADMCGAFDVQNGLVFFGVESSLSEETGKNNSAFIMDTDWSSGEYGVFTTMSADSDFQPNSLHYDHVGNKLIIGDRRGYVFTLVDGLTNDPKVNTAQPYGNWYRKAVVYDYISTAWSFGSIINTKWVTKIYIVLKNLTGNLSLDVFSYNDDKTTPKSLKPIRLRDSITSGLHQAWRWFKRQGLRCTYKQIQLKKGYVNLFNSDSYTGATVDGAANTVQLNGFWPTDDGESLVGHFFYLGDDDYTEGWEISNQSGDTLTLLDPLNTLPTSTGTFDKDWVVKGYPKGESTEIHGYQIEYSTFDNTFKPFATGDDGGNS